MRQKSICLTEKEVGEFLKMSRVTLWRLRKSGAIQYFKYGGKILYREEDIESFINQNLVKWN